jgi:hypothetical protein
MISQVSGTDLVIPLVVKADFQNQGGLYIEFDGDVRHLLSSGVIKFCLYEPAISDTTSPYAPVWSLYKRGEFVNSLSVYANSVIINYDQAPFDRPPYGNINIEFDFEAAAAHGYTLANIRSIANIPIAGMAFGSDVNGVIFPEFQ